jgi:hypothetical protein
MTTLTKEEIAYSQQKNREHMYYQAQNERHAFKDTQNDESAWSEADTAWSDYRYMELCEKANIAPW